MAACDLKVETRSEGASVETSTTTPAPAEDDIPSLTTIPEPVGMQLSATGTLRSGPLTVEVLEKDGRPYCSYSRRIVSTNPTVLETGHQWSDIGGGFHVADDRAAPWIVYVHTTHELYAFDGRGGLERQVLVLNPDGTTASTIKQLTAGETWSPGEELLQSLPAQLLARIDAARAGR
ncbi:MAG: hypothetical protein O2816_11980 [Planctomycetota bacterium]|nr:hypothetical protein [Planctomycetota bacterium]